MSNESPNATIASHIRCKEVYFPQPGPREPGSTNHKRHYHDAEYLIILDPPNRVFHLRKKGAPVAGGGETFIGPVRTVDQTHAEFTPVEVPRVVDALSLPPLVKK